MSVQIIECEQGTPEWYAARLGIPTASEFHAVLANGKGGEPSKTRRTYMMKLIGERLTQEPAYSYNNDHMERGKAMEDEARDLYCFARDTSVQRVGFVRNEYSIVVPGPRATETWTFAAGCSPDSLVDKDGMLEIKTKLAHLQIEALLANELPSEHRAQVQGQLWVAEREWCDFVSYWPRLKPLIVRVRRDEEYIARLAKGVELFCKEMETLMGSLEVAA